MISKSKKPEIEKLRFRCCKMQPIRNQLQGFAEMIKMK